MDEPNEITLDGVIQRMITALNGASDKTRITMRRSIGVHWNLTNPKVKFAFWHLFSADDLAFIERYRKEDVMFAVASIACYQDRGSGNIELPQYLKRKYISPDTSDSECGRIEDLIGKPITSSGEQLRAIVRWAVRAMENDNKLDLYRLAKDLWYWNNGKTQDRWGKIIACA